MHSRPIGLLLLSLACTVLAGPLFAAEPAASSPGVTPSVTFELDVQPLLTRYGCNSGPCHGKSRGQNGFALSLLGFDSEFDYLALVGEGRGRRQFNATAEGSLLLRKATGEVPHGGGKRIEVGSPHYELLQEWMRQGSPRTPETAPKLVRVVCEPATQVLTPNASFQLKVFAEYSDGSRRNVTDVTAFQSSDRAYAAPSNETAGLVQAGPIPGEAALMARYMNNIAVCRVLIPQPGDLTDADYDQLPRRNPVDDLVWQKLKLLKLLPSAETSEAAFLRRAYLRIIGRQPTPEETRAYLADASTGKRDALVDRLLERPEYADYWANKWADLLRPNPYRAGMKAVWNLDAWLRQAFRKNQPYDQFVRELVTAQGSSWRHGQAVVFRDRPDTVEIASSVSQLFLGVRLECAKCHHHPFEVWSQDDFFGFAAFFTRIGHKGEGLSPPISGGQEMIFSTPAGQLAHGRTGAIVDPKPLAADSLKIPAEQDPREVLAGWMTSPDNPYFAKVMASRMWAELMGTGLVEPVDDLRATNPASNEPLLDYLAQDFREKGYNIKHLIRRIMTSQVAALSSKPTERNLSDTRNFSRYYRQRLRAEVLLDAVNDCLDTEEEFPAMPAGSRATQVWTFRSASLFLDTFGRPDANQDPPCERTSDSTTPQILHLMNSPSLNRKLALDTARPAQLAASALSNEQVVEEAYLWVYCRPPTADEKQAALELLPAPPDRRKGVEDLFWVLLNTPEFLFVD
ncbi:MAG: DUF1549 and DUF1553 domain-containing protein [Planctomycetaceae bacterium]